MSEDTIDLIAKIIIVFVFGCAAGMLVGMMSFIFMYKPLLGFIMVGTSLIGGLFIWALDRVS